MTVTGSGGTGNELILDDSTDTTATDATLADTTTATKVTGFGPIGPVTFSGLLEVDLEEGSADDTLSLTTSVNTIPLLPRV